MDAGALVGLICVVGGTVLAVAITILIFYLLTLQKALNLVSPRNRLMEPGTVWFMLIPCFNIIWQFFIAIRVPDSLRNEFRDRDQDDGSDYGKSLALSQAILGIVSAVISNGLKVAVPRMETVATIFTLMMSLLGLVLFIMFWVKIAGYSNQLAMDEGDRRRPDRRYDDYDDDDDDDRGLPRRPSGRSPDTFKSGDPGQYK